VSPASSAVTLAIPVRDEEASIRGLLESLSAQLVQATEIVVCDAGSKDRTREIALAAAARVRLVEAGPAYPGRARNVAVAAATQSWIAFIDGGCRAEADWLEQLLAARDAVPGGADAVYGDYDPFIRSEWDAAQALAIVSPRNPATGCRPPFIASSLVRRETFLKVGGFPENLRAAEDLLFFEALEKAGAKVVHAPRARIRWTLAPSPRAVFRRLRLYSAHHAAAGLGRTWHHRVLAMNALGLALLLAGFVWPLAWALLGLGALARLWRTVMSRRSSAPPEAQRLTAGRWARAAVLLVVADAACVLGYLDYLRGRVATSPR
jgi:glycosyltransferase involved in cell wall biosynthesis